MKVYVVTSDDWCAGFGTEMYLRGVFLTREKAQKLVDKLNDSKNSYMYYYEILEVDVGKEMHKYIGGYVE